ncbi:MAG: phosphodiester glycosidase family protein, partial [Candidatus Levyibacteriota bacterium]
YQDLTDLQTQEKDTSDFTKLFASSLEFLSQKNYASATSTLTLLDGNIQKEESSLAVSAVPAHVTQSNSAPSSGFSRQSVSTPNGTFVVDIIAADLNSTRVIVDTASDGDCSDNCPVLPLADYVARNGAFAGINGSFFCPADYPSCAGKVNSFDTLLMNKNKHYINSANNVYSTVPAVIFKDNWARFVTQSLQWGRDTGVDSVIAMQPLLVFGGNIAYSDSSDPKFLSKGPRSFIANKGSTVYIGFTLNATMGESAQVMKTLGMDNALNLDEGGSSALWSGGYVIGPGRNLPNAVLFVHK